jgi:RND family efflux transporter MFP subunit
LWIVGCLACALGCGTKPASQTGKAAAPPTAESQLATVTLSQAAEGHLGIATAAVEEHTDRRRRTLGAQVVIPPGKRIVVSAPLPGTVLPPLDGEPPPSGAAVERDQAIFAFTPLLTPEREVLTPADRVRLAETLANLATSQVEAERQVEIARVQLRTAETAAERAQQLLRDGAGSRKAVEEAEAAVSLAREALLGSEARHKLLAGISLDVEAGELAPRAVVAPLAGKLGAVHVAPGETVTAGEPLFEVIHDDRVWLRVPVYVGTWRGIDVEAEATIHELGSDRSPGWSAQPVTAPPAADAATATVDLYYEMDNFEARLRPGERVSAVLTLRADEKTDSVPWKAILHDYHGGTWVYERTAPQTFVRRRVAVQYVVDDRAVIESGLPVGAEVVTDGAVELYGYELGFGH